MRLHPTHRTSVLKSAALLASCLGLVVASAAPASSAGQLSGATGYEVDWRFGPDGDVVAKLTERSYSFVDDLRDPAQSDRAISKPDRGESVRIAGQDCVPGNYGSSAVTIYGQADWFNASKAGTVGVKVSLLCKGASDGLQHRYRWGYTKNNCVQLRRTVLGDAKNVGAVFSVTPGPDCPVEHALVSNSGKATAVADGPLSFISSIELLGLKQQ